MSFAGIAKSPKVDNHRQALKAKVDIRQRVLDAIEAPAVFDGFAGTGQMHAAVWSKAATYVGCDLKWQRDDRLAYVADNRRVLRAIDLTKFNLIDLDAWGSPWEQALIVAARRPVRSGELFGMVLTDGCGIAYKANQIPGAIRVLTGLRPGIVGLSRMHDELIDRAVAGLARRMRCSIEKRWQAQRDNTGPAPRYVGLVLRGLG